MSIELPKMRQEFEAWAGSDQSWLPNVKRGRNGVYTSLATGAAWHAWQEASRLALERCADLCNVRFKEREYGGFPREASTARSLRDAIRALADLPQKAEGGRR